MCWPNLYHFFFVNVSDQNLIRCPKISPHSGQSSFFLLRKQKDIVELPKGIL